MYKFFLYSMLVILYLGLAKTLSPSELGISYLQNEKSFSKLTDKPHVTFILTDTHVTGFLIKTYYQKYRVITGYEEVEDLQKNSLKRISTILGSPFTADLMARKSSRHYRQEASILMIQNSVNGKRIKKAIKNGILTSHTKISLAILDGMILDLTKSFIQKCF